MSLVLNVEILGEFKNLTAATKGSQSELSNLNKKISGFSRSAKSAFASIGVGLSFAVIAKELGDATKAAVEDAKAQAILAKQLENTTGANASQVKSVEDSISKWQTQFGVLDDQLRPAYATLIRSTGDITTSNKLMAIALDASAATGKSLEQVTLAMGKSFNGSDTALIKLMPSLKGSKDMINDLAAATSGAAATAANTDPYMRMTAIFADLQEKIGGALLPALGEFSTWLASPGGTEALTMISDAIVQILRDAMGVAKWVVANKNWLGPLATSIGVLTTGWNAATRAVAAYNAVAAIAAGVAAKGSPTGAAGAISKNPLPGIGGPLVAATLGVNALLAGADLVAQKEAAAGVTSKGLTVPGGGFVSGRTPIAELVKRSQPTNVTVNVSQAVTAKTIIDTVSAYEKATGTTLAQALR